jgi:hypothetical protein
MFNTMSRLCTGSIIVGLLILPTFGADHARVPPLKKPVSIPADSASISQYLVVLFQNAGIHGGIAVVNQRCEETPEAMPEFKGDVQGALEKLVSTGHEVHWSQVGDSLVVHNMPSPPTLLTVVVHEFRFSRKEPLTKSSSGLLDTPEVSDKVRSLRLVERGPEFGFAAFPQLSTAQDMVTLTDKTVLDALNSIAGNHAVWLYKESWCDKNVMSVNWPVR